MWTLQCKPDHQPMVGLFLVVLVRFESRTTIEVGQIRGPQSENILIVIVETASTGCSLGDSGMRLSIINRERKAKKSVEKKGDGGSYKTSRRQGTLYVSRHINQDSTLTDVSAWIMHERRACHGSDRDAA